MRCAALFALAAIVFVVSPLRAFGQDDLPKMSDGYVDSPKPNDNLTMAPSGYFGLTDIMSAHAVSSVPATAGKSFDTHFTMSNKVQKCPQADGTVEGDGEFSGSADYTTAPPGLQYTNTQTGTTSKLHISVTAKAKYKVQVGDNSLLKGPIDADIQYTFTQSGSTREQSGALSSPAESHYSQHLTQQFELSKDGAPKLGDIHGGDPLEGGYGQAHAVAFILTYFGGMFYGAASTYWTKPNECAQVVFNPPSKSRNPVLGSDTKVTAEIRTKGGQGARGTFLDVKAHPAGGSVTSVDESTDPGSAAIFTYTAPNRKVDNAGFHLGGTSRAGNVAADWDTGLGTDWSGQIYVSRVIDGDAGQSDLQTWSSSEAMRITVDVKDGIGKATGYAEHHYMGENRHNVANNGSVHVELENGSTADATADGTSTSPVTVTLDRAGGTYSISAGYGPFPDGRETVTSCIRDKCTSEDHPFSVGAILPLIGGKLSDLNHLSGSQSEVHQGLGRSRKGTSTFTLTWDLARTGTTQ